MTNLQTAVEALERIANPDFHYPSDKDIAREALAALRQVAPQTVSREEIGKAFHERIRTVYGKQFRTSFRVDEVSEGIDAIHALQLPAPQTTAPIPTVDEIQEIILNFDHVTPASQAIHAMLTARLGKGADHE